MKKIKLFGGYHNVEKISIEVSDENFGILKKEYDNKPYDQCIIKGEDLDGFLSDGQRRRLDKHFCGIGGCTCGSYYRDCHIEL